MVEFGEQLRRAREKKGMTQQALAEQLSMTKQTVSHWECGERYPDLATTKKISQILNVSHDDLISEEDMENIVERNPVIENSLINTLMVLLYTVAVISLIITPYPRFLGFDVEIVDHSTLEQKFGEFYFTGGVVSLLQVAGFLYCLINAIKGKLSPRRIGLGWIMFFTVNFVIHCTNFIALLSYGADWQIISLILVNAMINLLGVVSCIFFFIKKNNNIMWATILGIISIFGLYVDVLHELYDFIRTAIEGDWHISWYGYSYYWYKAALYAFIIYQVVVLYRKRKVVAEIEAIDR